MRTLLTTFAANIDKKILNMNQRILILLLALTLIASCSKDSELLQSAPQTENTSDSDLVPVRFFGSNITVDISEQSRPVTRATGTSFDTNDEIGITVVNFTNTNSTEIKSKNYADNICYKYNGTEFIPATDKLISQYEKDECRQHLIFYAVYPYIADLTPNYTFSIKENQTSHHDYTTSDLSFQKIETEDLSVNFSFTHLLGRMDIKLVGDGSPSLTLKTSVKLINVYNSVDLNLNATTGEQLVSTNESKGDVVCNDANDLFNRKQRHFQAIIAPQQISNETKLQVTVGSLTAECYFPDELQAKHIGSNRQLSITARVSIIADQLHVAIQ